MTPVPYIQQTKINADRAVIFIVVNLDSMWGWLHTALIINNTVQFKRTRSKTNVHSVRPHHGMHSTNKDQHRAAIAIVRHFESEITPLCCTKHSHHVSNSSNINIRTVCPEPTRHDTHSIRSANEDQYRAVITSVVYTRVILRPHTASNTNKTAIQTYVLFVQGHSSTRSIHSTNERAVIIVIAVYLYRTRGWIRPHTPSKSNNAFKFKHAAIQTYTLLRPGPTWYPFYTFDEQRSTQAESLSPL